MFGLVPGIDISKCESNQRGAWSCQPRPCRRGQVANDAFWYYGLQNPESARGLGRVKTPTFNLRVETPSRFRKFENQKCLRLLLREDDRENNSAHSWLVHVFTQPGSKADLTAPKSNFRFTPESGLNSDIAPCPKSATSGLMHCNKSGLYSITSSARASSE